MPRPDGRVRLAPLIWRGLRGIVVRRDRLARMFARHSQGSVAVKGCVVDREDHAAIEYRFDARFAPRRASIPKLEGAVPTWRPLLVQVNQEVDAPIRRRIARMSVVIGVHG